MTNESQIREILKRIDALHHDVEALLPKVEIPRQERSPAVCAHVSVHCTPAHGRPANVPSCPAIRVPAAVDSFFRCVADWFFVRGVFATKGMSREFSVATRWLLRVGAILLVGAMSYFLILAINRGWIGPTQRVCGMIFWGVIGIAGGTWVKVRKERYAIVGEVAAAIGLVALYLSFGLGHRYFNPPVIPSQTLAFVGLMSATVMAGWLSVRFNSLMIATLSLVGGFIVPMLVRFNVSAVSLDAYLVVVTLGATAMAALRSWTVLAFAALGIANIMAFSAGRGCYSIVNGLACTAFFAQAIFLTLHGVKRRLAGQNAFCWAFVCMVAMVWILGIDSAGLSVGWWCMGASCVMAMLALYVRRCGLESGGGRPVCLSLSVIYAAFAMLSLIDGLGDVGWECSVLVFALFSALLADLGERIRERTLTVFSLIVLGFLSLVFLALMVDKYSATLACGDGQRMFSMCEIFRRGLSLWPIPSAFGFFAWRSCARDRSLMSLRAPLMLIAALMAFAIVSAESYWLGKLCFPVLASGLMTIVWSLIAFGLLVLGVMRCLSQFRLCGLALLAVSVVKALLFDTASLATPARVAVFACVGVVLIVGAILYLRFRSRFEVFAK